MTHDEEQACEFIQDFVAAIREAQPIVQGNLDDNLGELLPHLLMADLTRWSIQLQRDDTGGNGEAGAIRDRALAFLEARFADADDLGGGNVIAASFLENLHQAGSERDALVRRLGPTLRANLTP